MRPHRIKLHQRSRELELDYAGGEVIDCPASTCASIPLGGGAGHGSGQETLQTGKLTVGITAINPVGRYALQLVFDDGHDTGLPGITCTSCTRAGPALAGLSRAPGAGWRSRDPDVQVIQFQPLNRRRKAT